MTEFNHAYSFAFEVISKDEQGEDVTGKELRRALGRKLFLLTDEEVLECCDSPFDTFEVEK